MTRRSFQLRFSGLLLTPFEALYERELREVLEWRNHDAVRNWMDNRELISYEEHLAFVERLKEDGSKRYYRVDRDHVGLGVVSLVGIDFQCKRAELGIYRNPYPSEKGLGRLLMCALEWLAIDLQLHRLDLKVRHENKRAIRLYELLEYELVRQDAQYQYRTKELS